MLIIFVLFKKLRYRKPIERREGFVESRIVGLLASMVFSVPTSIFIWFGVNKQLAIFAYWDVFISSTILWTTIFGFMLIALIIPNGFPAIMGRIWRAILSIEKWWGW